MPQTDGFRLARAMASTRPSLLRQVLARAEHPGVISFALGMPAVDLFPTAAFSRATTEVLCQGGPQTLQYGMPHQPLKAHIVALMAQRGVQCHERQIFLTSGSQQGMRLLAHLLLDPGNRVLVEEIIYEGFLLAIRSLAPELSIVPTSPEEGLDVDAVEGLLEQGDKPALLYTIPSGHNPLGSSLDVAKRTRLVELARRHQMPIIEDDAYGFLYYEDEPLPPLRALEDRWVFYLGSFSKILAPGLRLGWMVVPEELMSGLSALKHAADLDTTNVNQQALSKFLDDESLQQHLVLLRGAYKNRRDTMIDALARYFPPQTRWTVPRGGMYIWAELPENLDAMELLSVAIDTDQVAFSPGMAFAAGNSSWAQRCLRLSFANSSPSQIEEGIRRLSRSLDRLLTTHPKPRCQPQAVSVTAGETS